MFQEDIEDGESSSWQSDIIELPNCFTFPIAFILISTFAVLWMKRKQRTIGREGMMMREMSRKTRLYTTTQIIKRIMLFLCRLILFITSLLFWIDRIKWSSTLGGLFCFFPWCFAHERLRKLNNTFWKSVKQIDYFWWQKKEAKQHKSMDETHHFCSNSQYI